MRTKCILQGLAAVTSFLMMAAIVAMVMMMVVMMVLMMVMAMVMPAVTPVLRTHSIICHNKG